MLQRPVCPLPFPGAMRRGALRAIALCAVAACAGGACSESSPNREAPGSPVRQPSSEHAQWLEVSDIVIARMALQPGEKVLFVGAPGHFDPLLSLLRSRVTAAGAEDLGAISVTGEPFSNDVPTEFTATLAGLSGSALHERLRAVDLGVMMPGASTRDAIYTAIQDVLRAARPGERYRTIHFHWEGAYAADGTPIVPDASIDAVYKAALLGTDYRSLAREQERFERAMRGSRVRVTTALGTDLSFDIGERPVTKQDGDASALRAAGARNLIDREIELPAGAIRVAPIEESVTGRIAFPDSDWGGQRVQGLVLTFEHGRVVDISARAGEEAVRAELGAAGPAGRAFREFALGFNPRLAMPPDRSWIPYYGYGEGVVRLSLGDNTELGGRVGGGYVRWNFFTDATVLVGDEAWVIDGRAVRR